MCKLYHKFTNAKNLPKLAWSWQNKPWSNNKVQMYLLHQLRWTQMCKGPGMFFPQVGDNVFFVISFVFNFRKYRHYIDFSRKGTNNRFIGSCVCTINTIQNVWTFWKWLYLVFNLWTFRNTVMILSIHSLKLFLDVWH